MAAVVEPRSVPGRGDPMTMTPPFDHPPAAADAPQLSIVVPALNEVANLPALVDEVRRTVLEAGVAAELIIIDDGSSDATPLCLRELAARHPWLRARRREKPMGQSAAIGAGIEAARGRFIATLDADGQNDPADLPRLLERVRGGDADFAQGDRSANRRDRVVRRVSSWVGRVARRSILGDPVRDTGCATRVVRAELARQFPLQFRGMHRFLPAYAAILGAKVVEVPVNHRPRRAGQTKYGMLNRGLVGLVDCLAVRWMRRRYRDPATSALEPGDRA
jgi:dolichol-phosphate mannosyltransferase